MTLTTNDHRWSRRAKEAEGIHHEDDHLYVATRVDEVRYGARTYLTHPNLLHSIESGPHGANAAANIAYLSERARKAEKIVRYIDWEDWAEVINGQRRPLYGEVLVLTLSDGWGWRAFALATSENKALLEELDVCLSFYETDPEDILIDWEDAAWEEAEREFKGLLPIDIQAMLGRQSRARQAQIMWDAYCAAKRQARKEPTVCWDRVLIDTWALGVLLKGQVIKTLLEERTK